MKYKLTKENLHNLLNVLLKYLTPSAIASLLVGLGFNNEVLTTITFLIANTIIVAVDEFISE